jgi:hypothetical protein
MVYVYQIVLSEANWLNPQNDQRQIYQKYPKKYFYALIKTYPDLVLDMSAV